MPDLEAELIVKRNDKHTSLTTDINLLRDFVTGLMESTQRLERKSSGVFIVNLDFFTDALELLNQKFLSQHDAMLIKFEMSFQFEDGYKRTIYDPIELKTFREVRNLDCLRVRMTVSFLITFPDSDIPEKQDIDLIADKGRDEIHYIIKSRNRSISEDVESLLDRHVKKKIIRNNFLGKVIQFIHFIQPGILILLLSGGILLRQVLVNMQMPSYNEVLAQVNATSDLSQKIIIWLDRDILDKNRPNLTDEQSLYFWGSIICISVICLLVELYSASISSFICISEEVSAKCSSEENKRKFLEMGISGILFSLIASIIYGVFF